MWHYVAKIGHGYSAGTVKHARSLEKAHQKSREACAKTLRRLQRVDCDASSDLIKVIELSQS